GLVGVVSKSGGTKGIVDSISRYANSARRGQIATWLIGLLVFFDDYANCLIVGNTMRPISDKLKISREKLAYIVDATAAPVSSIALISTWIGFEVGLIGDGLSKYGIDGDPYLIFLQTIPYRFYPILSLIMIVFVVGLNRDVGSMLHAEKRARVRGEVLRPGSVPTADTESEALIPKHGSVVRWQNAAIPIIFLVVGTFAGLYMDGLSNMSESTTGLIEKASINEILAYADSFKVLLWTSFLGTILAITLAASQRILSLRECLNSMISGMRSMMTAMIILVLAWSIGTVCKELETAHYIVEICSGIITPSLLPFLTFVMAALISFATGSSWATMAILIPIIIPIAHEINTAGAIAQEGSTHTLVTSLSSILAGAVFGDHCSPISDTTIMSSMSAGVDHIDHVRTQLPYALTVALVGVLVGDIPSGFGVNPWISLTVGSFVLFLVVRFLWKPLPASEDR
ncbi:MAG: Na+/H+ antiporter NhaC family protein, partial [Candidatus Glassbacteria bacterium]